MQVLSPFVLPVRGRFDIQPSHFTERHGALVIIVLGESVVDIGIGAEGHPVTVSLALSAVLGLALTAALWWAYFGAEDDERAERAMVAADPAARPALALAAYFYAYIPMLLGIVALASGVKQAIVEHREHAAGRAVRGDGLRRRPVPGRQRGVPARAADRPWTLPADRGGRGAGRLLGRRDAERRGRDGRADPDRRRPRCWRSSRAAEVPDSVDA